MVQLDLVEQKIDMALITNRREINRSSVCIDGHIITSMPIVKYFGVMTDEKIDFKGDLDYTCENAAGTSLPLARMMTNSRGPPYSRRFGPELFFFSLL